MTPETVGFHFAEPLWLLALLAPLAVWLWPRTRLRGKEEERIRRYADAHLLPHLLVEGEIGARTRRRRFALWSLLWTLAILAMAGPRWDFTQVDLYQPGNDLVVLLDLSRSMDVTDVKPSRLVRARQEVEDLLTLKRGLRIGLIAYASVAHVVTPISDDAQTLRHLLPSLSTDLIKLPGSRLSAALERARRLLAAQPAGSSRALLLISDGDFDEPGLEDQVGKLYASGIRLHVLGIGTEQGGEVTAPWGGVIQDRDGKPVISRLNEPLLRELAAAGGGLYQRADFRDDDTRALVERMLSQGMPEAVESGHLRVWQERYYLLVVLMLVLLLPWFRHGRHATLGRR